MIPVIIPQLFAVTHQAFTTDHTVNISTFVVAGSREEALESFNKLARERSEYPHMWRETTLDHVRPLMAWAVSKQDAEEKLLSRP